MLDCVPPLHRQVLGLYRNQGGFDMLSRTVDQIRGEEQCAATADVCTALRLNGLVMVGGTYTNTDAAFLAEYMLDNQRGDVVSGIKGVLSCLRCSSHVIVVVCCWLLSGSAHLCNRCPSVH